MKRLLALAIIGAMLLGFAGCASLFDREYYSVKDYQAESATVDEEDAAVDSITNYSALRRAITQLVSEHVESAELQLQNYDGSISQDISTACWEVKSSSAIGAFAVDYISYDLSRIVSYYQAEIYITYKRSADQLAARQTVANMSALSQRLDEALRAHETYLVLEISSASATADAVREDVETVYYADPLACPVLPALEVGVFPESGVSRILEITLNYALTPEELAERREALGLALDLMMEAAASETETAASEELAEDQKQQVSAMVGYLAGCCQLDEQAGATAWDALVGGTANSVGLAMALEAGCQAADIPCITVFGRLNNEEHCWNIVTIGGVTYHVDAANRTAAAEEFFLVGDEKLWGSGYWWDTSDYPVCSTEYSDAVAAETSEEPVLE